MNYLLDLDIIAALFEETSPFHEAIKHKMESLSEDDAIFLSVLSLYELQYSFSNTENKEKKQEISRLISSCKNFFDILPLSEQGAKFYGSLKAGLKKKTGMNRKALKKHNIDIMLSATALDYNCVLVAKDGIYKKHLKGLTDKLEVEDWTESTTTR
jgi:predicted nucleic acid-binding protein